MSSGTNKIVESIKSEAQEKADKIIQDAQAEIATINSDAEKTAEAEKNKILDNGKKQSDMKYQQIISEAKMNARRAELGAKEEVIEAALAKASSDDAEYSESLIKMIEEATEELGGGDLIVQVKESDVAKVEGHLKKLSADLATKTGVSTTLVLGEPIDAIGGAILKTRNGDIEVNNTIESRLDRFKGLLRSEVANVLFKNYEDKYPKLV